MPRIIAHLDMDAFFASVEQAVNPVYRGKPLIVGSRGSKYRTVVAAASYEAKACGVTSGMPTAAAFRLCPQAHFVAADSAKYLYASDRIAHLLAGYSDLMECASIDEFYLDFSHLTYAQAADAALRIKQSIRNSLHITGSVGIAPAKIIAKIAAKSRKPDGLVVLKESEVESFLEGLAVGKVPGIGPHIEEYLHELSVFTCGQLRRLSLGLLVARFGRLGAWLFQVSRGLDSEEVRCWNEPDDPPKSISHSYTVERELVRLPALAGWVRMLSEMVGCRLRKQGLEANNVSVYLKERAGFLSREKNFHSPTADPAQIFCRGMGIIKSFRLRNFAVRALGVGTSGFMPSQGFCLFPQDLRRRDLLRAVDAINERFGEWSIYPAAIDTVKRS